MQSRDIKISFTVLALGATVFYFSNSLHSTSASRSIASEGKLGNCLEALKSFVRVFNLEPYGRVKIVTTSNRKVTGKIVAYARGGLEIRGSGSHQLISYSDIATINSEVLSEIEIYQKLLSIDIEKTSSDFVLVRTLEGGEFVDIKAKSYSTDGRQATFVDTEDRLHKLALEEIYHFAPHDELTAIRKDIQVFAGEFVSVKLKNGDIVDGIIALSIDRKYAELVDINNQSEVTQISLDDIELIFQ